MARRMPASFFEQRCGSTAPTRRSNTRPPPPPRSHAKFTVAVPAPLPLATRHLIDLLTQSGHP